MELEYKIINEYKVKIKDRHYDKVFININNLNEIGFKKRINDLNRPILSISNGNTIIYRKLIQGSNYRISKNEIGILKRDLSILNIDRNTNLLRIDLANIWGIFLFYYKNPKQDLRIATKLFLLSIPLSIIISVIGAIIYDLIK